MRTLPEIVAEMRELIAELETHTGKPPAKESYSHNYYSNMSYSPDAGIDGVGAMPSIFTEFNGLKNNSANDLITINLSEYKFSNNPST